VVEDEQHPKLEGMFLTHDAVWRAYRRCVDALDIVSSGHDWDKGESAESERLTFALRMFDVFWELFDGNYQDVLTRVKLEVEDDESNVW